MLSVLVLTGSALISRLRHQASFSTEGREGSLSRRSRRRSRTDPIATVGRELRPSKPDIHPWGIPSRRPCKMNPHLKTLSELVDQILGHYRIVEQIGAGGMGVVY